MTCSGTHIHTELRLGTEEKRVAKLGTAALMRSGKEVWLGTEKVVRLDIDVVARLGTE